MTPILRRRSVVNLGALLLLSWISSFPVSSQKMPPTIHSGEFLKPNEFLTLSKDRRAAYAMGFVDGALIAPIFEAPEQDAEFLAFRSCIRGKSGSQIAEIIEKKVKNRTEQDARQLNMLTFEGLLDACYKP